MRENGIFQSDSGYYFVLITGFCETRYKMKRPGSQNIHIKVVRQVWIEDVSFWFSIANRFRCVTIETQVRSKIKLIGRHINSIRTFGQKEKSRHVEKLLLKKALVCLIIKTLLNIFGP